MARQDIDTTGNEAHSTTFAKIKAMFAELYAASSTTPTPEVTSLTASGAIAGATVTSSGLATSDTLKVGTGTKTATATAGAATLAKAAGKITSEALTTAAGAAYTLTITNTAVAAADIAVASAANGTNTQGTLLVERVTPGANSLVVVVRNIHASEALNGTLVISFVSFKA